MPVLFGIFCGLWVMAWLLSIGGPILAALYFCVGRFFIAALLMAIGLFCASHVWHDFHVQAVVYKELLILGLALEVIKWICVYLWRNGGGSWSWRNNRIRVAEKEELSSERVEPFFDPDFSGMWQEEEVERPMKDVTPRRRQIPFRWS